MNRWSWNVLQAGRLRLDGGGMFGIIPKTMWSRWSKPDDANRIGLQTNCLLLRDGMHTVLIETGCGDKWTDKERSIYDLEARTVVDALREIEVEPETIDLVIVSHLHFDHAGGLTTLDGGDPSSPDARPRPVFPNARVIVQSREWEDALANRSTMTRTYLASHLEPVADQVQVIEGPSVILPGLRVEPMPGHTPGQHGIFAETADGTVAFLGDLIPTRHHAHPSAATAYDMEPYETHLVKQRILRQAADEGWIIVLDHESGHPITRAIRDDRGRVVLEDHLLGK